MGNSPNNLGLDLNGKTVNETQYRGMIGSLMYLTASRPDIQFLTCLCARYQTNPKESHLIAVKRIFRDHILKGDIELHFIPIQYQLADIFTKPMDEPTFKRLIVELEATDESNHSVFRWENRCPGSKTPKLQNLPYKLRRFPKAKRLELKVDSEENNLQNTHLSPRLRHPNLELANQKKKPSLVRPRTKAQAILYLPHYFFHFHSESALGCDASTDSIAEADPGTSALNDFIPLQQDQTKSVRDGLKIAHTDSGINKKSRANDISKKIKMEDLSDLLKDTRSAFFTPDSPQDEHIIVSDESEEEETKKDKDTYATSHDIPKDTLSQKEKMEQQKAKAKEEVASLKVRPPYPDINQLTELLISFLKPKLSKLLALHDFASCLPTKLKELPSKFTELSRNIKELKKHNIQWELPTEFLDLPSQISSVQKKLQTLDSLPSQATASPAEGEKNTNPTSKFVEPNMYDELVDLLGIDIVTQYYNNKLLYDKYNDKMLKRRKSFKITNYNVLIQKGPISLNVYREDGTIEVISDFKVGDLYLAEWREVVQTCLDRKEKGWKTIYGLIKKRMKYLDQTEKELKIDFNKPLKEQDPLKKS
ncbi:hypothetical protein Tco_0643383 [Tanacetum coccineum]